VPTIIDRERRVRRRPHVRPEERKPSNESTIAIRVLSQLYATARHPVAGTVQASRQMHPRVNTLDIVAAQ
jgi:hypothetical protein